MAEYKILTIFKKTIDLSNGLEEVLRERIYHYKKFSIPLDFWVFKNLKLTNNFVDTLKSSSEQYTLITTNKTLINWLKLRYGYFEDVNNLSQFSSKHTIDGYFIKLKDLSNFSFKSFILK